ncbi:uracil-DNA glycosylase family protein [Flavitalea flava]
MDLFDPGPPAAFARHFAALPDYTPVKDNFWFDWGPVFYRGRLDGSAKVICVASDPGPTERIACRTLVGNAGQRVQGFLNKIGLTSSYVCVNGFAYALYPSHLSEGIETLSRPDLTDWRNNLFDMLKTPNLQAVVAFGEVAQQAVRLWTGIEKTPVFNTFHPSYHTTAPGAQKKMMADWNKVVLALRLIITRDAGAVDNLPLYGSKFIERDYAAIPRFDLPFGMPDWFGHDTWFRAHRSMNSVSRPSPDDRHTLKWKAPKINS